MATQTFEELIAGANKIKDNELPESNTHDLVGEQLLQMINKMQEENSNNGKKFSELELKNNSLIVDIVGFGINAGNAGVTKTGDIYYKTDTREFRKCINFENSQYETVPLTENSIMYYKGTYYCDLIDKTISPDNLWSLSKLLTTNPKKDGLTEFSIIGKINEGLAVIAKGESGGAVFESTNFSYIEFEVFEGADYYGSVPYQSGSFGIAFYNSDDVYIDGITYNVDQNYINLPLFYLKFTAPKGSVKAKATIFNDTNRKVNGHYSYFYPLIGDEKRVYIEGIAESASKANVKNVGDVYFQSTTKKFRRKISDNLYLDVDVTDETIIIYRDFIYNGHAHFINGIPSNNIAEINLSKYANFVDNGVINYQTGDLYTDNMVTSSRCDNYIPCGGAKCLNITMSSGKSVTSVAGIAFYDKDFNYISGIQRPIAFYERSAKINIMVPPNAVYFRTTYFNSGEVAEKGDFFCSAHYNELKLKKEELDYRDIVDGVAVIVDRGAYELPMGDVYSTSSLGASSYINCKGALYMDITLPVLTSEPSQGLVFFDEEGGAIDGVLRLKGDAEGIEKKRIYIPDNAVKFKTTFWNFEKSEIYGEFSCEIYFQDDGIQYRSYQKDLIFFSEKVNQTVNNFWDNTNEIVNPIEYKSTTGVLILPDNYSPDGKPSPIIMYCHGFSHGVWYDTWGSTENFLLQKKKWASMGFAVFDCNGARNNNKQVNFTGAGSIQFVSAYRKCYEYIKQHYNVEDRICVVGGSAGGPTGINFCYMYGNLVKKCALLSAWTDLKTCSWGQGVRDTFVEYLGFNNTTDYEEEKTVGYDPTKRIIDVSGVEMCNYKMSVKAWVGSTEVGSALYEPLFRFVNALRNVGNAAYIRQVDGLTHSEVVSGNNDVIDTEVASWFVE